ncbi:MAG: phosphatase PAP2 family protein [Promethearchaeati archaeon SRVP18_Atabeyarchaeia-1]
MNVHEKSIRASEYLTYVIGNIILMVVLFYILLNNLLYEWTGQLYPVTSGFRLLLGGLDDAIPFVPEMVIFYQYLFYGIVILTMLFFAFVEYRKGYALSWSLVIVSAIAIIIYIVFPVSTYEWRVALTPHLDLGNFWQAQVYSIYTIDTPFNCFPSLHAAVSTICFYTWYQYSKVRPSRATKIAAIVAFVISAGVILSTLFIKQHYIVDEIAGILLAWVIGRTIFNYLWKAFKLTGSRVDKRKVK